ncbi:MULTISPECIES: hypothetical protein [unclassified Polaromonas]|uniref:hypothetical protein n=1 Tax=unclassified Polaromonas TaxID=2638319 RepID=UPI00129DE768|nr:MULTISPECIES: hypothetical protein [unclassified Polaromonas]QGJ17520.1 hypothetical protein F7R28_03365 [Polaromonas sp. Pch-P]
MVKTALKVLAGVALVGAALFAAIYYQVFIHLQELVASTLELAGLRLPPFASYGIGTFVAIAFCFPITMLAIRLFIKPKRLDLAIGSAIAASTIAAWTWYTSDWLFDMSGRPLVYVCPSLHPGSQVRVQRNRFDHELGGDCPHVTSVTAAQIVAQRSGVMPEELQVNSVTELEVLPRFSAGKPVLFVGEPLSSSSPPRLFKSGGMDTWSGTFLQPATKDHIDKVKEHLVEQDRITAARKQAKEEESQKVKEQNRQDSLSAIRKAIETSLQQNRQAPPEPLWGKFFTHEMDEAPLVVVFGAGGKSLKVDVSGELAGGEYWPESSAKKRFLTRVSNDSFVASPLAAIDRSMFPPELRRLIVARVDESFDYYTADRTLRPGADVTYVIIDVHQWVAYTDSKSMFF